MGNTASSGGRGHQEETVDFGHLTPQGIYSGSRDWNHAIVTQLICERKLAPFYRPLEDYEDTWDDNQILAARKDLPESENSPSESSSTLRHESSHPNGPKQSHGKRPTIAKDEIPCPEAAIYRGAVECPICFLYYPPNINHSRCCDQAICTECFVQIKRAEPTTTHIVSEPAACPYCVQDKFGVVYTPPPWRAGIGSDGTTSPQWPDSPKNAIEIQRRTHKRRQKSFGHDNPEVVTTDQIRPDWESKLAAVRAAVTRRANRRIIMRQVGDRLIPVGVTSGRVHAISPEEAAQSDSSDNGGSRRSRRQRNQNQDLNQFLGTMGLGGQDLEELMVMEAMRLSLVEHEEQQRREAANRDQNSSSEQNATSNPDAASVPEPSGSHTPTPSAPSTLTATTPSTEPPTILTQGRPNPTYSVEGISTSSHPLTTTANARRRTPSPANQRPSATLQAPSEPSSPWARRPSDSRPFSTISTAITATSTATAILKGEDASTRYESATGTNESTLASASATTGNGLMQAVSNCPSTIAGIHSSSSRDSGNVVANPVRPQVSIQTDECASSIFSMDSAGQTATSLYDVLGSSPDSEFSREPLLGTSINSRDMGLPEVPSRFGEAAE